MRKLNLRLSKQHVSLKRAKRQALRLRFPLVKPKRLKRQLPLQPAKRR